MSAWMTKGLYHVYQVVEEENLFIKDSLIQMPVDCGVSFVVAKLVGDTSGTLTLKNIMFDQAQFTPESAKKWTESAEHLLQIKGWSQNAFQDIQVAKSDNMVANFKELSDSELEKITSDEMTVVHSVLHAIWYRDKAGMDTTDWSADRIRKYHDRLAKIMLNKGINHPLMSDLDGLEAPKALTAEGAGDVLTEPDLKPATFKHLMTSTVQNHAHCATMGPDGDGFTSVQKGHSHNIVSKKIEEAHGHAHAITITACSAGQMKWLQDVDAEMLKAFVLKSAGIIN